MTLEGNSAPFKIFGDISKPRSAIQKEQGNQSLKLRGYADADFAADPETRRSCAGYMIFLGGTMISWSSKTERSIVFNRV